MLVLGLSSNRYIFNKNKGLYKKTFQKSGFKNKLSYLNTISNTSAYKSNNKHKNRKRNIWFNPHPFCRLSKINIDQGFLKLINKHFENNHTLRKVFKRRTVKISYSCTNNILKIINSHNKTILNKFNL